MTRAKLQRDKETGLLLVDGPEEVPEFATDEEEVAFWEMHAFSEHFWKRARHVPADQIALQKPPHARIP